jgi:hypothetical protein
MRKPLRCGACAELAQFWDGSCVSALCAWCVPEHDEYVVRLTGSNPFPRRLRQPGQPPRQPRWRPR